MHYTWYHQTGKYYIFHYFLTGSLEQSWHQVSSGHAVPVEPETDELADDQLVSVHAEVKLALHHQIGDDRLRGKYLALVISRIDPRKITFFKFLKSFWSLKSCRLKFGLLLGLWPITNRNRLLLEILLCVLQLVIKNYFERKKVWFTH